MAEGIIIKNKPQETINQDMAIKLYLLEKRLELAENKLKQMTEYLEV